MPIKTMDWAGCIGQKARIYRNLNNGRMSIQIQTGGSWKVVRHVVHAVLQGVRFHVSEAGRQRVIRDRRKNIHAWGEGTLVGEFAPDVEAVIDLAYNPYEHATFMQRGTNNPIYCCNFLLVCENQVYVTSDAVGGTKGSGSSTITSNRQLRLIHSASSDIDSRFAA